MERKKETDGWVEFVAGLSIFLSLYLKRMAAIGFPINFTPIGLDYDMTAATFANSQNVAWLRDRIAPVNNELNIQVVGYETTGEEIRSIARHHSTVPSRVTFTDGSVYTVRAELGRGTYGLAARVRGTDGNNYCLKIQDTQGNEGLELSCYREALVHYILYSKTQDVAGENKYVTKFFKIGRSGNIIFYIVELMAGTLRSRLRAQPDVLAEANHIVKFFRNIRTKLKHLFTVCRYNHGDFKSDNVMYDTADNYKLIDLGFSRLYIGGNVLQTNTIIRRCDKSRDISQIAKELTMTFNMRVNYGDVHYIREVRDMIYNILDARCDGLNGSHATHSSDLDITDWLDIYEHFNHHNNANGTSDALKLVLANLPPVVAAVDPAAAAAAAAPVVSVAPAAAAAAAAAAAHAPVAIAIPPYAVVAPPPFPYYNAGCLIFAAIATGAVAIALTYFGGAKKLKKHTVKNRKHRQRNVQTRKSRH